MSDKNTLPKTLKECFKSWAEDARVPDDAMGQAEAIFMTGADYATMLIGTKINELGNELTDLAGVKDAED